MTEGVYDRKQLWYAYTPLYRNIQAGSRYTFDPVVPGLLGTFVARFYAIPRCAAPRSALPACEQTAKKLFGNCTVKLPARCKPGP